MCHEHSLSITVFLFPSILNIAKLLYDDSQSFGHLLFLERLLFAMYPSGSISSRMVEIPEHLASSCNLPS